MIFLPDVPELEAVASAAREAILRFLPDTQAAVISHASGRPWVLGELGGCQVIRSSNGSATLLLGPPAPWSMRRIRSLLDETVRTGCSDELLAECAGEGVLGLCIDGSQLICGALSSYSRIYIKKTLHGAVLSDSAVLLAYIFRLSASLERIAMRLCEGLPRFPFAGLPLWPSIDSIPSGCMVHIYHGDISGMEKRWWSAPAGEATAEEASEGLIHSLSSAILSTTHRAKSVTADLSGGIDSSSIAYVLASIGVRPRTFHVRSVDDRVDDIMWARRAAEDLCLDLKELPRLGVLSQAYCYMDAGKRSAPTDFPAMWWGSYGFLSSLGSELEASPHNVHFTGVGGDELFGPLPAASWSVMRERGLRGIRFVRHVASSVRQPFGDVLRSSMSAQTFEDAVRALPSSLKAPRPSGDEGLGLGDWFPLPGIGRILSGGGRALALAEVERTSANPPNPLDGDRGRHQMLESLQFQGEVLAQINQEFGGSTQWHSPYLRRGVIEAASRARVSERFHPNLMKPVLFAAMREVGMPAGFFTRPVSGEYSADSYAEFFRMRDLLKEGVCDFLLAESGIIDVSYIKMRLSDPSPSPGFLSSMESLISTERWLRQVGKFGLGI